MNERDVRMWVGAWRDVAARRIDTPDIVSDALAAWRRELSALDALTEAAERGDVWRAVWFALMLGEIEAERRGSPMEDWILRDLEARARGGDGRRGKRKASRTTISALRDDVRNIMKRNAHLSRTQACRIISPKYGIPLSSAMRYTKEIDSNASI